ncbi:putative galactose oxidase, beta-propeller [Rosa chinensis]|uniref:Putative galactose oxidase, beta-propeller n=1 Tax=Rosa chinensis TaxID=74649 RepID=A0A2P6SNT7_ROSCH|nr:putative galactose oxidase, beta-propeller [Rosa chinensis]
MGGGARSRARAKKRAEESRKAYEARERKKPDEAEPLLYLCTFEIYRGGLAGYRVQVIRLSDLFIPFDTPITIFGPKSQAPKSNSTEVLRQFAFLDGEHVPGHMGFGVLGSRIVLAGGWFLNMRMGHKPKPTYVLETDQSVEPNPRFISTRGTPNPKTPYMIPELEPEKPRPWMREIDGKLYALSGDHIGYAAFEVFDPKTDHVWAPLPKLQIRKLPIETKGLSLSSCAVVGTKILITLPLKSRVGVVKMLCFDVAHPERSWTTVEEPPWWQFHSVFPDFYNEVLVLDLEDDDCEKLLFTYDFEYCQIRVSSMKLSNEGEPKCIQPLDEIDLPDEFKNLDDFLATSYSCAHLGGRRVCFSFVHLLTLLVFTFEFSYSISGIFSVKALGHRLFEYYSNEELRSIFLGGCFVL